MPHMSNSYFKNALTPVATAVSVADAQTFVLANVSHQLRAEGEQA